MALELSTLINITTRIAAGGAALRTFGLGLLVTIDSALPAGGSGKMRRFDSIADVEDFFDDSDVRAAATVWFSADPPPKALYIGRWASADVDTTLEGGDPASASDIVGNANSSFTLNGNTVTTNLSSTTSTYSAIASAIESAIQSVTGFSGAEFDYVSADGAFVLTLDGDGEITGGELGTASTGTDISALLGMTAASGATYKPGHDEETVQAGVAEMIDLAAGANPVALMLSDDAPLTVSTADTRNALAAFAQAGDYIFALLDTDAQALVANDSTSHAAVAFAAQQGKVAVVYSEDGQKPDVGLMALMSAQNLDSAASIISPNAKVLPGVTASAITAAQRTELARKRCNVYASVGGLPSLLEGYTARPGYWLDAQWWLLWLKNRLETAIWNAQRGSRRLTRGIMQNAIAEAMQAGVSNGGLQGGRTVSAATKADIIQTTGNDAFDGVLSAGYLVWVDTSPTQADIDSRIGRWKAWGSGSEAIHQVFGDLTFQN